MNTLNFEKWTNELRYDCIRQGRLPEFNALAEQVLKLLWESGLEPSVKAITSDGKAFRGVKTGDRSTYF